VEAELPPSTVDVDRAVSVGRRRERTRRGLAAGALAGVTVLAGVGVVTVLAGGDAVPPARNDTTAASTSPTSQACVATRLPRPPDGRPASAGPASRTAGSSPARPRTRPSFSWDGDRAARSRRGTRTR
jgi:hypothetical protein